MANYRGPTSNPGQEHDYNSESGESYRREDEHWLDEHIWKNICRTIDQYTDIDSTYIQIKVEDGVATIEGTIDSRKNKRLIQKLVERVSGVRAVHNDLRITENTILGGKPKTEDKNKAPGTSPVGDEHDDDLARSS